MGVNRAKYFLMTGDRVSADEAERLGLVNFVVEDKELMPKALEIAERLANGPARAISASKVPINKYLKIGVRLIEIGPIMNQVTLVSLFGNKKSDLSTFLVQYQKMVESVLDKAFTPSYNFV